MYLNEVTVIGFTGQKPEVKYLSNGTAVTRFTVATKRSWKDENQQWQSKTQWHTVVGYGDAFATRAQTIEKGAHVMVRGEHTTRTYQRKMEVLVNGKPSEAVVEYPVIELKAEFVKGLDHASNGAADTHEADGFFADRPVTSTKLKM
jgi:single-strand DNA-binding protein